MVVFRLIGVVVPLVVVAVVSASRPLSFDGAMNMQVASSLAEGGPYGRYFGGYEVFPSEIQTSSYFLFLTAAAIRVFGETSFAFQFGNLVFVALLLAAVSWVMPRSRLAVLLVPTAALVATPGLLAYSTGGYGEGAVAALAVVAIALVARAATVRENSVRDVCLAMASCGVAISIKTVAVALAPVVGLGLLLVAFRHGHWVRTVVFGLASAAVPFVVFELYRWRSLGTGGYRDWWAYHFERINVQATGAGLDEPGQGVISKIADHMHLLAQQTSVAAEWWLLLFVAVPLAVVAMVITAHRAGALDALARPLLVVAGLTAYGSLYVAWWLAVTSTEKAWLRRITIGLFALMLAAGLLTHLVATLRRRVPAASTSPWFWTAAALTAASALAVVAAAVPTVRQTVRQATPDTSLSAVTEASADVADLARDGAQLYGIGWWSAPVVSLYSGVQFENLSQTPICGHPAEEAIEEGDAYVVWDYYAENLGSPEPSAYAGLVYHETTLGNDYASVWRIELPEGACE